MSSRPLVSVVLPTRNRASWLERAIVSVLDQTYPSIELVVVDDGSTDGTREVLDRFRSEIIVRAQPCSGAYAARNRGVEEAHGDLVAFIDSDDAWRSHKLEMQVPLFEPADVGLVFGDAAHVEPQKRLTARTCFSTTPPARGAITGHLAKGNCIPTVTVVVRKTCLLEIGGFPTSHEMSADYLTWYRIARRHCVDFVDDIVADYTVHAAGISSDLGRAIQARIELFAAEIEQSTDPEERRILRELIFNLGLNLLLAAVRPRHATPRTAWREAYGALGSASPSEAVRWMTSFAARRLQRSLAA